ncbi:DUF6082 family protein [Actinoplanes sp. CA-142083]|uniref:DUF6082 family protein n=1 Tax=Actinoplanes sp. CA-142083 TaxID=3239903 RepID=UPI003D919BAB
MPRRRGRTSGDENTWTRWSDVGQAFGVVNSVVAALAVAALIITSVAHARSQRDQQTEISVRQLHVTLTRMAIDNPHLAEVWPRTTSEDSVTQSQHMYAEEARPGCGRGRNLARVRGCARLFRRGRIDAEFA